ncbi:MAG: ComEC/Rec2 family competence protein [Chloroflexi bacterium]|nr:ComEC/Rec2 family competence protein [Chloroflexota bacterium]
MFVVYLTVCWFMGIALAVLIAFPPGLAVPLATGGLISAALLRRWRQIRLAAGRFEPALSGGARYTVALPLIDANNIAFYNDTGAIVGLLGLVNKEPDIRDNYVNLRVAVSRIAFADGSSRPVMGDVLVQAERFPVILYGTEVAVNGRLETPPEDEDFSYKAYLARQGIYSMMMRTQVDVLAEDQGNPLLQAIYALKRRAQATINHLIPDPEAALLSGILLGNDNGIPPDLAADFRTTGMTHIIAISGFNIALIIVILVGIADPFFSRKTAVLLAIIGIFVYTILVGADASVVRAAIMGSVFLVTSRWLGRPNFAYASLFFTGFFMTLINPFTLWDVGFQLSFAATLGLMLYADPFTQWARRRVSRLFDRQLTHQIMGVLSEAVLLTLAAQILTVPLMVGYFGQLSLVSLVANALFCLCNRGDVVGWVGYDFWDWSGCPWPAFWLDRLAVFGGDYWPGAGVCSCALGGRAGGGSAGGRGLDVCRHWRPHLVCQTDENETAPGDGLLQQNVGQRTAVTLQFPHSHIGFQLEPQPARWQAACRLPGCGPGGRHLSANADRPPNPGGWRLLSQPSQRPVRPPDALWDRHLDLVVATHPDADHVAGLVELFDRYTIDYFITDGSEMGDSPIYDALLQAAKESGVALHVARAGEVVEIGDGVRLEVVHPGPHFSAEDRNNSSVSLRVVYGDFSLLLTGDAEEPAEQAMLAQGMPLQALVFKAGASWFAHL